MGTGDATPAQQGERPPAQEGAGVFRRRWSLGPPVLAAGQEPFLRRKAPPSAPRTRALHRRRSPSACRQEGCEQEGGGRGRAQGPGLGERRGRGWEQGGRGRHARAGGWGESGAEGVPSGHEGARERASTCAAVGRGTNAHETRTPAVRSMRRCRPARSDSRRQPTDERSDSGGLAAKRLAGRKAETEQGRHAACIHVQLTISFTKSTTCMPPPGRLRRAEGAPGALPLFKRV